MGICEIALYVNNLEKSKNFYVKYFNAIANEKKVFEEYDIQSINLSFEDGTKLRLIARPEIVSSKKFLYDSGFRYIKLKLGSKEIVDDILERLRKDGVRVLSSHVMGEDGQFETVVLDNENNQIVLVD